MVLIKDLEHLATLVLKNGDQPDSLIAAIPKDYCDEVLFFDGIIESMEWSYYAVQKLSDWLIHYGFVRNNYDGYGSKGGEWQKELHHQKIVEAIRANDPPEIVGSLQPESQFNFRGHKAVVVVGNRIYFNYEQLSYIPFSAETSLLFGLWLERVCRHWAGTYGRSTVENLVLL